MNISDCASRTAGIIGSGVMAKGIAFMLLRQGFDVDVFTKRPPAEAEKDFLGRKRFYCAGMGFDFDPVMERLACRGYDYFPMSRAGTFIETTGENMQDKTCALRALSEAREAALIATNTSSISVSALGAYVRDPSRLIGIHFINPPHSVDFVEIVKGASTSAGTVEDAQAFCTAAGKDYVVMDDIPGQIINRLLFIQINEAFNMMSQYGLDPADVEKSVKSGAGHPAGPVRLAEVISVDTCITILKNLYEATGNVSYKPAPLLERLAAEGILGAKNSTSLVKGIRRIIGTV